MQEQERSGVIMVGGIEYAVGMFWQTAEDPKGARQEAKLASKQEVNPADLFVMREGFVAQWAIGWTSLGHKKDMPAGAASLADVLTGNWLAVFNTPEGWWFVAARRDAILPDGDVFYNNEDEPRARFETEFVRGGWDRVFIPEEWGMGGDTTPLEELLAGHEEPKLVYLNNFYVRLPKVVKVAAVAAVVGVVGVGYIGVEIYNSVMEDERLKAEALERQKQEILRKRREAEAEAARLAAEARRKERVARVWEKEPPPGDWMVGCAEALDRLSIVVPGWDMQDMGCSNSSAAVSWKRGSGGSLASAQYGLKGIATPSISVTGEDMTASLRIDGLEPRGHEEGWKLPVIRQNFLELFQNYDGKVTLKEVPRPPKPPNEKNGTEPPRPRPPAQIVFSFNSSLPPQEWAGVLSKIPNLIIDRAAVSVARGGTGWAYSGRVYEELSDEEIQKQNAILEGS